MTIYSATADVTNGSTTVTINTGDPLSEFNCTGGSTAILGGVAYFIDDRTDTVSFELSRPYEGVTAAGVDLEISPLTQTTASLVQLSTVLSQVRSQLNVLDRNSQGLFYVHIGVTGDADPGPGNLGLNNSDPAQATEIYIDNLDANSAHRDVTALLARFNVGTTIRLRSLASTAYYEFDVTGTAGDRGGWYTVTLSPVGHSGVIGDGEPVSLSWVRSGEGLEVDASGTLAGRAAFDDEPGGFMYMANDGDGADLDGTVLFIKNSGTSGDWSDGFPLTGPRGYWGWSPRLALQADGTRRVLQLSGYVGGEGIAPTAGVGQYVSATGLTADIENAIDIRGVQGQSAYQVAVTAGYVGDEASWLESLIGDSAYEVAVANGFEGTEAQWLESLNGADGTDPGILFNWSEVTDDLEQPAGTLWADAADLSTATVIFVSKTNRAGNDITAYLAGLSASTNPIKGALTLTRSGGETQATWNVTAVVDGSGYVKIQVANHAGETGFVEEDPVSLQFSRAGDQGQADLISVTAAIAGAPDKPVPAADDRFLLQDSDDGSGKSSSFRDLGPALRGAVSDYAMVGWRDKLSNGNFDVWTRGTNLPAGSGIAFLADRWFRQSSTGTTQALSRQSFSPGQDDVPGNPEFFYRVVVASGGSAGSYAVQRQKIEGVRTLAGKTATLTIYVKADAAKDIAVEFEQQFGTGGSPSEPVQSIGVTKLSLTTEWQRFDVVVNLPSITGKTIGTDRTDNLGVYLWLEAGSDHDARTDALGNQSGTFDIAHVSLVEGDARAESDPFPSRHIDDERRRCRRYCRLGGTGAPGFATLTNALRISVPNEGLRAAPSLSLVKTSISVWHPNSVIDGTGLGLSNSSEPGRDISMATLTGFAANSFVSGEGVVVITDDFLLADAEF